MIRLMRPDGSNDHAVALVDEEDVDVGSLPALGFGRPPVRSTDPAFAPPAVLRRVCEATMNRLVVPPR
jgi:hypothetical protein